MKKVACRPVHILHIYIMQDWCFCSHACNNMHGCTDFHASEALMLRESSVVFNLCFAPIEEGDISLTCDSTQHRTTACSLIFYKSVFTHAAYRPNHKVTQIAPLCEHNTTRTFCEYKTSLQCFSGCDDLGLFQGEK